MNSALAEHMQALNEGAAAYERAEGPDANPYRGNMAGSWRVGWVQAQRTEIRAREAAKEL